MGARLWPVGRIAGAVAALTVVAATSFAGQAAAQMAGDGLIPEGDWTEDEVTYLLDLIDRTEATLPAKFPAVATADELANVLGGMGYHNFGVSAPGGYDHWINNGWLFDDHLVDPEFPESLVYQIQQDGMWHLVSAMFMLDPAIDMDSMPEDVAWLPGWHGHPELCVDDTDGTFAGLTDPEMPSCPAGSHSAATPLMMHVWIVDNECDHRFAGIGVQGVHCDVGMHDPGEDPHEPGHDPGDMPDDGMNDDGMNMVPVAPAASPVTAQPSFTG